MSLQQHNADVVNVSTALAGRPTGALVDRLAEKLGGLATASAVYGPPVERDGVTIIPVARVRSAFGGGGGAGPSDMGGGGGGGGAVLASPVGYIEIANGKAEFHSIGVPPALATVVPVILAACFGTMLILGSVRRLVWRRR